MCNESAIKILHTFVLILGKFSPAAKKAGGGGNAIILSSRTTHLNPKPKSPSGASEIGHIIHTICAAIYYFLCLLYLLCIL